MFTGRDMYIKDIFVKCCTHKHLVMIWSMGYVKLGPRLSEIGAFKKWGIRSHCWHDVRCKPTLYDYGGCII